MKQFLLLIATLAFIVACTVEEDGVDLGQPPVASFTAVVDSQDPNTVILTNTSQNADLASFDYQGSDRIATAAPLRVEFPFAGEYTITMTAIGPNGTDMAEQTATIASDAPGALSPTETLLTGGSAGKVWVWSQEAGAFGVGPSASGTKSPADPRSQAWFSADANFFEAPGCIYNDSYEFKIDGTFLNNDNGDIFWQWSWANGELGASQSEFNDACFATSEQAGARWTVEMREEDGAMYPFLVLSQGSTMGYYEGTSTYQIFSISENEMILRHGNGDYPNAEAGGGWRYGVYVTR